MLERYRRIFTTAASVLTWMLLGAGFISGNALAVELKSIAIVVSGDSAFSRDTASRLQDILAQSMPGVALERTDASALPQAGSQLVITVGEQAWKAMASMAQRDYPILAVMPNRSNYEATEKRLLRNSTAIFHEQPLARPLNLISLIKPHDARVGVVLGPPNRDRVAEFQAAANERKQQIQMEIVDVESAVGRALSNVIRSANVLLAIPDPVVQTTNTVQPILLMSYRAGIPVVGFSAAYQRAGAMVSLYSTPVQLARQAAEAVIAWHDGRGLPSSQAAKYFTVGINQSVARSLGIEMPSADDLEQKLRSLKE